MKHFLIQYRPPRATFVDDATAQESAVIEQHFRYLKSLQSDGRLQLAGRIEDGRLGIALIEAVDEANARQIMEMDPAVREGVFSAEVHPFQVALIGGT